MAGATPDAAFRDRTVRVDRSGSSCCSSIRYAKKNMSKTWTAEEVSHLRALMEENVPVEEIQRSAFPHRTVTSVLAKRNRLSNRRMNCEWRRRDDRRLLRYHAKGFNAGRIHSQVFPTRTIHAVRYRLRILTGRRPKPWTPTEIVALSAHAERGRSAEYIQRACLSGRSVKAVRAKLRERRRRASRQGAWTPEEDARLLQMRTNRVVTVDEIRDAAFPERSVMSLRMRLHSLRKKKEPLSDASATPANAE